MRITAIRHATCAIEYAGIRLALDPILYGQETLSPVKGGVDRNNPLVALPANADAMKDADAILLTHAHRDHFDPSIVTYFGVDTPVICAEEYQKQLSELGFTDVRPLAERAAFRGVEIELTKGQHGRGAVGKLMGNSYGFMMKAGGEPTLYITGDTVWCRCVQRAIAEHDPGAIIAFAGAATMGRTHITMNARDVQRAMATAPDAKLVAVHMEAWNHCRLSRRALRDAIPDARLIIPMDGETVELCMPERK